MRERNDAHARAMGIDETGPRLAKARKALQTLALAVGGEGAFYAPGADRRRDAHVRALIVAAAAFAEAKAADDAWLATSKAAVTP